MLSIPDAIHAADPAAQIDGILADVCAALASAPPMTRAQTDRAAARVLREWADSQGTPEAHERAAQMATSLGVGGYDTPRDHPAALAAAGRR